MEVSLKENLLMAKSRGMEFTNGKIKKYTKDNGGTIESMAKVKPFGPIKDTTLENI